MLRLTGSPKALAVSTGPRKTEAALAWQPLIAEGLEPPRLAIRLPMRKLASQIVRRLTRYV